MKIALGCDHAGFDLKANLMEKMVSLGHEVVDCGTHSRESVDYPHYARAVADLVTSGQCERGVLICGTGVGISIAANKMEGIRAVVCSEPFSAKLSRLHNNTNVLALGSRVVGSELAQMILEIWLEAEFEGGRHERRVNLIEAHKD
ncbi:MAG: ribose 5-phosphate isomerase B [Cardiobacteriaceae bacterium]|nr:ribose 5-phosphate isomerase B [Cardiobacteriaceae bacterium]